MKNGEEGCAERAVFMDISEIEVFDREDPLCGSFAEMAKDPIRMEEMLFCRHYRCDGRQIIGRIMVNVYGAC